MLNSITIFFISKSVHLLLFQNKWKQNEIISELSVFASYWWDRTFLVTTQNFLTLLINVNSNILHVKDIAATTVFLLMLVILADQGLNPLLFMWCGGSACRDDGLVLSWISPLVTSGLSARMLQFCPLDRGKNNNNILPKKEIIQRFNIWMLLNL